MAVNAPDTLLDAIAEFSPDARPICTELRGHALGIQMTPPESATDIQYHAAFFSSHLDRLLVSVLTPLREQAGIIRLNEDRMRELERRVELLSVAAGQSKVARVEDLERDLAGVRADNAGVRADNAGVRADNAGLRVDNAGLRADLDRLRAENERLHHENERLTHDNKRLRDQQDDPDAQEPASKKARQ